MGNGWVLFTGIVLVVVLLFVWSSILISKGSETVVKKAVESRFERINEVEGILYADDIKIRTFNIGEIIVGDAIEVKFYNNVGHAVQVTDIVFNDQSIYAFAPIGISYREKADFAVQVLKNNANQGALSLRTVDEVERILIEVDNLNDYIAKGKVIQLHNVDEDFAWKY